MIVYRLANKAAVKDVSKGTHRHAVVKALEALKEGTSAQIVEAVRKNRLLRKSKMDPAKAIQWMLGKMARDGQLTKVKAAAKVAAA
jgi:hypothetical protein